jgi:hypothetical protein
MTDQIQATDALLDIEKRIRTDVGFPNTAMIVGQIAGAAAEIPDSVSHINPSRARELAGKFLKALDLCGELVAVAAAYESKMHVKQKAAHSEAFLTRAGVYKTAKEKEAYAFMDPAYLSQQERYIEATMFRTLIENKREDLGKAYYLMRRISEGDVAPLADPTGLPETESLRATGTIISTRTQRPALAMEQDIPKRVPWSR